MAKRRSHPADPAPAGAAAARTGPLGLPRTVWALGFVSLFMDASSELIHALLPVFVVGTLGAGAAALGLVEGLGEAVASLLEPASGWLSDRVGKRRPLLLAGCGLPALAARRALSRRSRTAAARPSRTAGPRA